MNNETYWALKHREWDRQKAEPPPARGRVKRVRPERLAAIEVPPPVVIEEAPNQVPYRELQEQAKELGIPANQTREELEAALASAPSVGEDKPENE